MTKAQKEFNTLKEMSTMYVARLRAGMPEAGECFIHFLNIFVSGGWNERSAIALWQSEVSAVRRAF